MGVIIAPQTATPEHTKQPAYRHKKAPVGARVTENIYAQLLRARGRKGGRQKILQDDPKVQMAKKMSKNMSISIGEICATLKISRASYYRYLGL